MKLFLFVSLLMLFQLKTPAQSLSVTERKEITELARAFCSSMEIYSNLKENNDFNSYNRIFEFFNRNSNKIHAYDLFRENSMIGIDKNILGYLQDIETDYENDIQVEFKDPVVLDCIINSNGVRYAGVRVKKQLTYKGNAKEVDEIIFFILGNSEENLKVNEVIFTSEFKNSDCLSENNTIDIDNLKRIKFEQDLKQADVLFSQKSYTEAKGIYTFLAQEDLQNNYIKGQIEKCNSFISLETYTNKAEQYFAAKEYEAAIEVYYLIQANYSGIDNSSVTGKIEICKQEISTRKYNKMIEQGDYYFKKGLYKVAADYYNNALKVNPNSAFAISQMERCKKGDPAYARNQIQQAVRLAEASNKNWGTAFRIMFEYDASGLLTTENYYFMVMLLDEKNKYVKREMNFRHRDLQNYLNIYAVKLRRKAKNEYNVEMQEKALFLLDNIINPKYQR